MWGTEGWAQNHRVVSAQFTGQKTRVSSCQQMDGILKKLRVCLCPLQNFGLKLQPVVTVLRLEAFGDFLTHTKGPGRRTSSLCVLSLPCDITSPPSWRMQPLGAVLDAELPSPGIKLPGFPSGKKTHFVLYKLPSLGSFVISAPHGPS